MADTLPLTLSSAGQIQRLLSTDVLLAPGSGSNSVAISGTASGINSTSVGVGSSASQANTSAYGEGAIASAGDGTALGAFSTASAADCTAVGRSASAISSSVGRCTALGEGSTANGQSNTALGQAAVAGSLFNSTSIGRASTSNGQESIAIGVGANVPSGAHQCTIVGNSATIAANKVEAIGIGYDANIDESGGIGVGRTSQVQSGHTNAGAWGKESQSTAAQRLTIGRVGGTASQLQDLQVSNGFATFGVAPPGTQPSKINDPAGQANDLDSEARTAIDAILDVLEGAGLAAAA